MAHPLAPDFNTMSDEQLSENLKELHSKLAMAYRSSSFAVPQIQMLLDDYVQEQKTRDRKAMEKLMKKSKESGNDWDDLIDIGS
jgi:GH35 family endo-1,4-beta-xylanase